MKATLRWACPDCPATCVDRESAQAHQDRTGHQTANLVVAGGRKNP